jgi:ATP-dependent Lon protease
LNILYCLAYFDIFNYPLSVDDIVRYTGDSSAAIEEEIQHLIQKGVVYKVGEYYSIRNEVDVSRHRNQGNERAVEYSVKAERKARLISKFPYVRGVYISGSLSKNFMSEDGDVDYFIVTTPNRLWVARTLLIAYKKVFLFNSRKYFCVNYFVDEDSLEIAEKNRFTATELVTLIPMSNFSQYKDLIKSNDWIQEYYASPKEVSEEKKDTKRSGFQKWSEPILNTKLGVKLDEYFLKITLKKWNRKFGEMEQKDFELALKSSKRVSKHHPSNFQKKVLDEFDSRMKMVQDKLKFTV